MEVQERGASERTDRAVWKMTRLCNSMTATDERTLFRVFLSPFVVLHTPSSGQAWMERMRAKLAEDESVIVDDEKGGVPATLQRRKTGKAKKML